MFHTKQSEEGCSPLMPNLAAAVPCRPFVNLARETGTTNLLVAGSRPTNTGVRNFVTNLTVGESSSSRRTANRILLRSFTSLL
uniref:Uncharacterized protein n=1 Tax=Human betaherpesvirus 6 TaxID=10368 RepID=A0A1W6G701_9BETA|nr:hypothetical protein [Human betaherpesvirus 6]